jgi:hypothetical protein
VSRQALTPTNVPASATNISTPSPRTGDLYYNFVSGLMVYDGNAWTPVSTATTLAEVDAGEFDGIAPYNGGRPTTAYTQILNGGTP